MELAITSKLLHHIRREAPLGVTPEEYDEFVAKEIQKCRQIQYQLNKLEARHNEAVAAYHNTLNEVSREKASLQKECLHYVTYRVSDPAGDTGMTICEICGATI